MFRGGDIPWPRYRFLAAYMTNARALMKHDMAESLSAVAAGFGDKKAAKSAMKDILDDLYKER